jgi:hypothetical protein
MRDVAVECSRTCPILIPKLLFTWKKGGTPLGTFCSLTLLLDPCEGVVLVVSRRCVSRLVTILAHHHHH